MKTLKFLQHCSSVAAAALGLQGCDYLLDMVQLGDRRSFRSRFWRQEELRKLQAVCPPAIDTIDSGSGASVVAARDGLA